MFTVTFVLYEKEGLDRTEALRYWRDTHGPLVGQVRVCSATCSSTPSVLPTGRRRSWGWRA